MPGPRSGPVQKHQNWLLTRPDGKHIYPIERRCFACAGSLPSGTTQEIPFLEATAMNSMNLRRNVSYIFLLAAVSVFLSACPGGVQQRAGLRFGVSFPEALSKEPLDGRMILMFSTDDSAEPRFQISVSEKTQLAFGIDVDVLKPGAEAFFDAGVFGYPLKSIADLPAGEYWVQALLHRYETFHLSDGRVLKLPMDRGEGQQWNLAPGNLASTPRKIAVNPKENRKISILLDKVIPPIADPVDTKFVKYVKLQSELLTKFWGRPLHPAPRFSCPRAMTSTPGRTILFSFSTIIFRTISAASGKALRNLRLGVEPKRSRNSDTNSIKIGEALTFPGWSSLRYSTRRRITTIPMP